MKVILGLLLLSATAATFAQRSDLKIAYNVHADTATGNYEIFVMNADGSGKKNISNHPGIDWVYYAYGNKLYFVSDRDTTKRKYQLFEMNSDGTEVRKISKFVVDDSYISSRKNGTELIVSSRKDGQRAFYIIDLKGNVISKVVPAGLEYFADPLFIKDGKKIVFRGCQQSPFKTRRGNDPISNDELYIINDDGTGLNKLTTYPATDTTAAWHSYHSGPPRWNSRRNIITYPSFRNGKMVLMAFDLKNNQSSEWFANQNEPGWHDWSLDGKLLVADMSSSTGYDIYMIDGAAKTVKRLTDDWRSEQYPVFVNSTK